jgi:hypothetical protein
MLVLTGGASPAWLVNAGLAVTAATPGAVHRVLDGQTHGVAAEALTRNCGSSSRPEVRARGARPP